MHKHSRVLSVMTKLRRASKIAEPYTTRKVKKVKVALHRAHTRLPSVGFRSRCRFLAVSLQVT